MMQLPRAKLTSILEKDEELANTVQGNIDNWMRSVQPQYLRKHWLLSVCPPEVLTMLSPIWKIRAVQEGELLVDGDSGSWGGTELCVILLDGTAEVSMRRPGQQLDRTEKVGGGAVINSLALISTVFDLEAGPPEYGEVVSKAEVISQTALILTVPSDEFKKRIDGYVKSAAKKAGGGEVPDPLARMREVATKRIGLLSIDGLKATNAMPEVLADMHLRTLANGGRTVAVNGVGEVLFEPGVFPFKKEKVSLGRKDQVLPNGSKAASRPGSAAAGRPQSARRNSNSRPGSAAPSAAPSAAESASEAESSMYYLISGEMSVKTDKGASKVLKAGDTFCSPLPEELQRMGGKAAAMTSGRMVACVSAHVKEGPCLVQCFDIGEVIHDLLNADAAEKREREEQERLLQIQREREALKERVRAIKARVHALELRLGLRIARDTKVLWKWAVRRIKAMIAMGQMPAPGSCKPDMSDSSGGSIEDQLSAVQKRAKALEEMAIEREERLKKGVETWDDLMPPVLPEEKGIYWDPSIAMLTMDRVIEVEGAVSQLKELRQNEKNELMQALPDDEATRNEIMKKAPGLDHDSLKVLQDYCNQFSGALAEPMSELQKKLRSLWEELRLPEVARVKFRWSPGQPLNERMLENCEEEIFRLQDTSAMMKSMNLEDAETRKLAGDTIAGMLVSVMGEERVRLADKEKERIAQMRAVLMAEIEKEQAQGKAREAELAMKANMSQEELKMMVKKAQKQVDSLEAAAQQAAAEKTAEIGRLQARHEAELREQSTKMNAQRMEVVQELRTSEATVKSLRVEEERLNVELKELGEFVGEKELTRRRKAREAEAKLRAEEEAKEKAATDMQAIARGRAVREQRRLEEAKKRAEAMEQKAKEDQIELQRKIDAGEIEAPAPPPAPGGGLAGLFGKGKKGGLDIFGAARVQKMLGVQGLDNKVNLDVDWHPLVAVRDAALAKGEELMNTVGAGEASIEAFLQQHRLELKPPEEATKGDLVQLQADVEKLQACVERLRVRFEEEDGLYLAIKALWKKKKWDTHKFAAAMDDFDVHNLDDDHTNDVQAGLKSKINLEGFRRFLAQEGIVNYADGTLRNLLRYADTTPEQMTKKPIFISALVNAMGKVPENPLYMTLLTPEETAKSPVSRWQRGFRKVNAAGAFKQPPGAGAGGASSSNAPPQPRV